jgi:hypothetical protein
LARRTNGQALFDQAAIRKGRSFVLAEERSCRLTVTPARI